jgi:hypothetical protein
MAPGLAGVIGAFGATGAFGVNAGVKTFPVLAKSSGEATTGLTGEAAAAAGVEGVPIVEYCPFLAAIALDSSARWDCAAVPVVARAMGGALFDVIVP